MQDVFEEKQKSHLTKCTQGVYLCLFLNRILNRPVIAVDAQDTQSTVLAHNRQGQTSSLNKHVPEGTT